MKKLLVVLLVLIAVGIAAAPALVGMQAEQRYQSLLDELQTEGLRVVRNEYRRGWMHSTAEAEFELAFKEMARQRSSRDEADLALLPDQVRFTLSNKIAHGPLLVDELRRGQIKPVQAVMDTEVLFHGEKLFPEDYPVSIQTRLAFDGRGKTTVRGPAVSYPVTAEMPGIRFDGIEGNIDFAQGFGAAVLQLAMPLLRIEGSGGEGSVEVRAIEMKSDMVRGVGGLMFGEGHFVIAAIEARDENSGQSLRIDQIEVMGGSAEAGGDVTLTARYSVQSLDLNGQNYAPSVVGMRFERLPVQALVKLNATVESIQRDAPSEEQMQMMLMGAMAETVPALLQNDPLFALEPVSITTPQGAIDARFSVTARGVTAADIAAMAGLVEKLIAEAELRIPEALVRETLLNQALKAVQRPLPGTVPPADEGDEAAAPPSDEERLQAALDTVEQQIELVLQQGFAVREGERLASVARLENGLLTINGKTFPLGGLMGQAMAPAQPQ